MATGFAILVTIAVIFSSVGTTILGVFRTLKGKKGGSKQKEASLRSSIQGGTSGIIDFSGSGSRLTGTASTTSTSGTQNTRKGGIFSRIFSRRTQTDVAPIEGDSKTVEDALRAEVKTDGGVEKDT